jgi:hypothetical protein
MMDRLVEWKCPECGHLNVDYTPFPRMPLCEGCRDCIDLDDVPHICPDDCLGGVEY